MSAIVEFSKTGWSAKIRDPRFPGVGIVARRRDRITGTLVTCNGKRVRAYTIETTPATAASDMAECAGYVAHCMRGVIEARG